MTKSLSIAAPDGNGDDERNAQRVRKSVNCETKGKKACVYNHKLILLFLSLFPFASLCYVHSTLLLSTIEASTFFFEMQILMFARQFIITNSCVLCDNKRERERKKLFFFPLNSEAIRAKALGAFSIFFFLQQKCTLRKKHSQTRL